MSTPEPPELPASAADGHDQRLHRWSWLFVMLMQLRQYLLPLVALLVFGQRGDRDPLWVQGVPLIVIAVLVAVSVLQYLSYRYRIGRDAISIRSGLLARNRREIPFARIHNVVVHQNPLHRLFGVAEVRLESAGGSQAEAQMRVLRLDQALALEQQIRQPSAPPQPVSTDTADEPRGPPALPATDEPRVLLRMPLRDVLTLGALSNRGWVLFAAGFGALVQVVPRGVLDERIAAGGREALGYANGLQPGNVGLAVLAAVLLLLAWLAMRVLSLVLALLRYHGFELTEQQRRLTVSAGLLSRVRSSVARRRIQAWTLRETMLQRWAGKRQLRIDSAASQSGTDNEHRALRELAPLASPQQCDALVQQLLPGVQWPPPHWRAVPVRGSWRLCLTSLWLVPVVSAALYWRWGPAAWSLLAWLPLALWAARRQMARIGWYMDGEYIAVRGGWWRRWWRWAELDKLQALQLSRSPLDRLLGTSTLRLDTAGSYGQQALQLAYLPQDEAEALLEELSTALARRRLRW